jgi:hypothetical protein
MPDIFLYSTLALSALSAADGDVGMLYDRKPIDERCVRMPYITPAGVNSGDYFLSRRLKSARPLPGVESKPEPLNGRGWTLQESILSRLNVLLLKINFIGSVSLKDMMRSKPYHIQTFHILP